MKKYPKYKDSGIEWIGEIPEHWEVKRLRNVSETIKTGSTPPSEDIIYFEPRELNWFGPGDFENLILTESKRKISNRAIQENKCRLFPSNSILLIGIGATVGKVGIVNEQCSSNQQINAIILKEDSIAKFYLYFLTTLKDIIVMEASSATLPIFNQTQTKNLVITFPPLSEQSIIANYLDQKTSEFDTLIINKKKLIELLKEERTAIINHAVTKGINPKVKYKDSGIEWIGEIPDHWEAKRIRFLFDIIKNISGELGYNVLSITQNGIKIKDITSGAGQLSMDYTKYQIVEIGDFAMNHMDLLTGYVDKSKVKGVTSPDYRVFRGKSEESKSEYFLLLFQMCYKNKIFFPLGQGSAQAGRWRLPTDEFRNFILPVPPKNEQCQIIEYINIRTHEIDTTITKFEKEIELMNEYKKTLISEVVTGKIDVREEVIV